MSEIKFKRISGFVLFTLGVFVLVCGVKNLEFESNKFWTWINPMAYAFASYVFFLITQLCWVLLPEKDGLAKLFATGAYVEFLVFFVTLTAYALFAVELARHVIYPELPAAWTVAALFWIMLSAGITCYVTEKT